MDKFFFEKPTQFQICNVNTKIMIFGQKLNYLETCIKVQFFCFENKQ